MFIFHYLRVSIELTICVSSSSMYTTIVYSVQLSVQLNTSCPKPNTLPLLYCIPIELLVLLSITLHSLHRFAEPLKKISKLVLPTPQITDEELDGVVKVTPLYNVLYSLYIVYSDSYFLV